MKITLFCLIIFTAFLNFSCQRNVESSPVAENEKTVELPSQRPTPENFGEKQIDDEMQIIGRFSNSDEDELNILVKFGNFTIKKDVVIKSDGFDSPETGVIDAVLSKKGKRLARFEGVYYPLGNEMSFGLFSFLGGTEKQLLVYDDSLHYEHDWIVTLSPKFEVIYNNADYDIYGGFGVLDIDKDGILELSAGKDASLGFSFSRNSEMAVKVIFKYDPKTHKYLPATHLYPEFVLQGFEDISFDEQLKNFKERKNRGLPEFLQIFLKYVYAGKEAEAWRFFDETEIEIKDVWTLGDEKLQPIDGKLQAKDHLKKVLSKDPIYKFIQKDLRK
jgi:hypothetical protein